MRKEKIAIYLLSAAFFAMAPVAPFARECEPAIAETTPLQTEAGLIHFDLIHQTELFSGLLQEVVKTDSENRRFELSNGSIWTTPQIEMVSGWRKDDHLVICQNRAFFSTDRYALVNLGLGKAVPISLAREAKPSEKEALYITQIDLANNIVTLNGSDQQWVIYGNDHGTLQNFTEHDRIMLGVNVLDFSSQEKMMRYILINTAKKQYVRATPLKR